MESSQDIVVVTDSIGAGITGSPSGGASKKQRLWLKRLKEEKTAHKGFRDRSRDVEDIYHIDSSEKLYVPLYWQVVQIEHSGVYSNQPVPDVRPRNETYNETMRHVAKIIRRGLAYTIDQESFDDNMHRAVDDYLAMSLGVIRVKVDSVLNNDPITVPDYEDQEVFTGYDQVTGLANFQTESIQVGDHEEMEETIGDQIIRWEYVPWRQFGWEPGNNWKYCDWIYFRHRMTMKQIINRFGKTVSAKKDNESSDKGAANSKTFDIYEIWHKTKKEVIFLAEGEDEPLEVIDDPLELLNFFPIPIPMMMNLPSDELIPQPDYNFIESYDVEINRLQERRMGLLEQIRAAGGYDAGLIELGDMLENEDGEYTPITNLIQRLAASGGGAETAVFHLPIQEKAQVIQLLTEQIQFVRSQVDEVLGIADIVRGVTKASESATAQEIKGRWVGVRLSRKRECVQYTIREIMRITAQLLSSHITPENLTRMTQCTITDEMLTIMQDDVLMDFAIDVETDSTVAKDEAREMTTKQEMLNGVAQYSQSVLPMVQQNMFPAGVASAILRSALKPYSKYDRELEEELGTLPKTMEQLQKLGGELKQAQEQLQQAQQQAQQWQMAAEQLQQQATEASSKQKLADAEKKTAEAASIKAGLPADALEDTKVEMNMELTGAQTVESLARARHHNNEAKAMDGSGGHQY